MLKTHLTLPKSIQAGPEYPPFLRRSPHPREAGLRIRENRKRVRRTEGCYMPTFAPAKAVMATFPHSSAKAVMPTFLQPSVKAAMPTFPQLPAKTVVLATTTAITGSPSLPLAQNYAICVCLVDNCAPSLPQHPTGQRLGW